MCHLAVITVCDRGNLFRCISDDLSNHFGLVVELYSMPSLEMRRQPSSGRQAGLAAVGVVCCVHCIAQPDMDRAGELVGALVGCSKPAPRVE